MVAVLLASGGRGPSRQGTVTSIILAGGKAGIERTHRYNPGRLGQDKTNPGFVGYAPGKPAWFTGAQGCRYAFGMSSN